MSQIVIVSGPPGAGKSAVCEALCERYDRTVHLETDQLYASIRMRYAPPWREGSERQNIMVSRAAARAAAAFAEEQYAVFIDGVIGERLLAVYVEELRASGVAVQFAVLLPSLAEILRRAHAREKRIGGPPDLYDRMHAMFADAPAMRRYALDTTEMTAGESADAVMAACGRGDLLVLSP